MQAGFDYMRAAVSVAATLWVLIVASDVLQPLLIALFLWLLLSAATNQAHRLLSRIGIASRGVAQTVSIVAGFVLLATIAIMLANSASDLARNLPSYEARLDTLAAELSGLAGIEAPLRVAELLEKIEIGPAIVSVAGSAAGFFGALIIVIVYIIFLGAEARAAPAKIARIVADAERRDEVLTLGQKIVTDIEIYVGVKTLLGLTQAVPTVIVLALVGVEAPVFWAVLIFVASFIPTIGTMIGIVFPVLMALVQFDTLGPAATVLATLLPVQLLASNWLEPRLMSHSLNLSPLVVFFGIFAGGSLWGITGALIIVPLLAMAMIVFSRIPRMYPVAVLLSGNGEVTRPGASPEG